MTFSLERRETFIRTFRQWGDAVRAAREAGCEASAAAVTARRWLARRDVRAALSHQGDIADRYECCLALTEMIRATPADVVDGQGDLVSPQHWRFPLAVREFTFHHGASGPVSAQIKLYDKLAAIRELARLLAWDGEATVEALPQVTVELRPPGEPG